MWIGIGTGLYMLMLGLTGAVLVFKTELEHASHPELYPARAVGQPLAPMIDVLGRLRQAYPDHRVASIYAPDESRPVYIAYVERDRVATTVLLSADSGSVLGERPTGGLLRWVNELHVNLLAGPAGRLANGAGGMVLFVLCVTGLVSWWPGVQRWRRALRMGLGGNWKRALWELHGAAGFWTASLLIVWAVTGAYFAYPAPFRKIVNLASPVTTTRAPVSDPVEGSPADLGRMLEQAAAAGGGQVSGLVLPASARGAVLVHVSSSHPAPSDLSKTVHVYFDQFSGEILATREPRDRTAGDALLAWAKPLHFGDFAGPAVKVLWLVLGLVPPLLFLTGLVMWWNRVGAKKWRSARRDAAPAKRQSVANG